MLWILTKGENPKLETGIVDSVGQLMPQYPSKIQSLYNPQMEMVMDVKVKMGDDAPFEFKQLPASQGVYYYPSNGIVVTDSKEAMIQEVENLQRNSQAIIESIPVHEKTISKCGEFLKLLNPRFAEDADRDSRLKKLEGDVSGILSGFDELKSMISAMASKKSSKNE